MTGAEKTMKWILGFCFFVMLPAVGADFIQTERDGWKSYRNEKFGYEMVYPSGMDYVAYVGGSSGELKDAGTGASLIR